MQTHSFQDFPPSSRFRYLAVFLLFAFFFVVSVFSVSETSWTTDELSHLQYGMNELDGNSTRFSDSKMPVSALNALPVKVASALPDGKLKIYLKKRTIARLMTILFSMFVAYIVFSWSRKMYGWVPGLISLALYVFDPNIIAHSQLVTTDIYAAGMILLSAYALWLFSKDRRWQSGLLFALVLGLAQLTKYTAVSLYLILPVTLLVHDFYLRRTSTDAVNHPRFGFRTYLTYAVVVVFVSIIVIDIGFLFNRPFTSLTEYPFRSEFFRAIQSTIDLRVPTPYPYLQGLDWIMYNERTGASYGNVYLLGQTRATGGFNGYYFAASLFKVPIATLIMICVALAAYARHKAKRQAFFENEWFLLMPVFCYTVYFNFFYSAQIGIRHYLVVFPLLYVFTGSLFTHLGGWSRVQKAAFIGAGMYLVASVVSYYPNYLAYVNEIIWDRKMAYKYLADSNIDWGQDAFRLKAYRAEHPAVQPAPEVPQLLEKETAYFVSVNDLVGVTTRPRAYQWLRENFEPAGMISASFLLFDIKPEEMQILCKGTNYCH